MKEKSVRQIEREKARDEKAIKFESSVPCTLCGHTLFYTANSTCVNCCTLRLQKRYTKRKEPSTRALAKLANEDTYLGKPCPKCHCRWHWTANTRCAQCTTTKMAGPFVKTALTPANLAFSLMRKPQND